MHISRLRIHNFRNFADLDVNLGRAAVIVGENRVGKSNLLYALRLLLDPALPDSARRLRADDFWDGLPRPLTKNDYIEISLEFSDIEKDEDAFSVLSEFPVSTTPFVARLTYLWRPLPSLTDNPTKDRDYEFRIYGGDQPDKHVGGEVRRWLPATVLPALRDAETDLRNWRRSPLAPLLDAVTATIDPTALKTVADQAAKAKEQLLALPGIKDLNIRIRDRLTAMAGTHQAIDTTLGIAPSEGQRLLRELQLYFDGGRRGISEASLGSANLLYLSLLSLELTRLKDDGSRHHTLLAIEEPEAHLHPHVQRVAFRDFLDGTNRLQPVPPNESQTVWVTTHSPHLASVAPLRHIVVLRPTSKAGTVGYATHGLNFDDATAADIERYLDATRGEILFAKGVILVEGDAELYIVPTLARRAGYDLDALGITVCSISGTHFGPYLKLLGPKGLNVPCAVLTDLDPTANGPLGEKRIIDLSAEIYDDKGATKTVLASAPKRGLFLNTHTLEVDLFETSFPKTLCRTIIELTTNGAAKKRAEAWRDAPTTVGIDQLLKDIEEIGKGRFAQRLAVNIAKQKKPGWGRHTF
jgi:putative ATP-dependent endonuclease of OLD family